MVYVLSQFCVFPILGIKTQKVLDPRNSMYIADPKRTLKNMDGFRTYYNKAFCSQKSLYV